MRKIENEEDRKQDIKMGNSESGSHAFLFAFNSGAKAYWKSLDENVVLVDCDGGLTAHSTGETDVVATIYGTEYKCHIVVEGGTIK